LLGHENGNRLALRAAYQATVGIRFVSLLSAKQFLQRYEPTATEFQARQCSVCYPPMYSSGADVKLFGKMADTDKQRFNIRLHFELPFTIDLLPLLADSLKER
jgi:hypothetical protein